MGRRLAMLAMLAMLVAISDTADPAVFTVHGGWTPWSQLNSPCSKSCGNGTQTFIRYCTNPTPQGPDARECQTEAYIQVTEEQKVFPCNEFSCWSLNKLWNDWDNCSAECNHGNRSRSPNCTSPEYPCGDFAPDNETEPCNTWDKATCPDPCNDYKCMTYAVCNDVSNDTHPLTNCSCVMGYKMTPAKICVRPPPPTPTSRPIPTMAPEVKVVATVLSKSASFVLIFFVTMTLVLFIVMRVFSTDRLIQMNMEIALLCGHLLLLLPTSITDNATICKIVSICLHFTFMACFVFMMLEAVHMYTMVAFVVKKNGYFNKIQNMLVGWGLTVVLVLPCVAFEWANYGGDYHCWLRMDTGLLVAQQLPIIVLMVMTLTLIEAAGAAEYKPLKGTDKAQLVSAKFSQRTNLVIMPIVYAHWLLGTLAEYQQNIGLYSVFSILNGWLGACVFFFHCSNNQTMREKLGVLYRKVSGQD